MKYMAIAFFDNAGDLDYQHLYLSSNTKGQALEEAEQYRHSNGLVIYDQFGNYYTVEE